MKRSAPDGDSGPGDVVRYRSDEEGHGGGDDQGGINSANSDQGKEDSNSSSAGPCPTGVCRQCRDAKVKCERQQPCGRCVRLGLVCQPQQRGRGRPRGSRQEVIEVVEEEEPVGWGGNAGLARLRRSAGVSRRSFLLEVVRSPFAVQLLTRACTSMLASSINAVYLSGRLEVNKAHSIMRSLGTRVLRYGRDSCQETLELISSILRVNWRRDLFGLGQDGQRLALLPAAPCASELDTNLPPVSQKEYDEASNRLQPLLDGWFQSDGVYAWTIGIRGVSSLYASPRYISTFLGHESDLRRANDDHLLPSFFWARTLCPEDQMEFFRCMAEVGFSSSSPANEFSLAVKCLDRDGVEFPATVRFRYATPEGGKEYVSVFSVHKSATQANTYTSAYGHEDEEEDDYHEAKAHKGDKAPYFPAAPTFKPEPCPSPLALSPSLPPDLDHSSSPNSSASSITNSNTSSWQAPPPALPLPLPSGPSSSTQDVSTGISPPPAPSALEESVDLLDDLDGWGGWPSDSFMPAEASPPSPVADLSSFPSPSPANPGTTIPAPDWTLPPPAPVPAPHPSPYPSLPLAAPDPRFDRSTYYPPLTPTQPQQASHPPLPQPSHAPSSPPPRSYRASFYAPPQAPPSHLPSSSPYYPPPQPQQPYPPTRYSEARILLGLASQGTQPAPLPTQRPPLSHPHPHPLPQPHPSYPPQPAALLLNAPGVPQDHVDRLLWLREAYGRPLPMPLTQQHALQPPTEHATGGNTRPPYGPL